MPIQFKRTDSATRANSNIKLDDGQPLWEMDTNLLYIGDKNIPIKDLASVNAHLSMTDLVGSEPIGDNHTAIYWNGDAFIAQPLSLQNASWEYINQVSTQGIASEIFNIGDEKTITLSTGESVTFQIWGFNHDDLADGSGKAGITFGMKNLLEKTPIDFADITGDTWSDSSLRTKLLANISTQLPKKIQGVLKPVLKQSSLSARRLETTTDTLFLFSAAEIFGNYSWSGGTQYDYWKVHNKAGDRIKRQFFSDGGKACYWWLRGYKSTSPSFDTWGAVSLEGKYVGLQGDAGICFGFCV